MQISGGEVFEKALRDISSRIESGGEVRIGFLEGATYPNGTSVAFVAAMNEFGHKDRGGGFVPPRPFFRNMIAEHKDEWPAAIVGLLKDTGYDVELTLDLIGAGIAGQLRQSIVDLVTPPLAPSTVARKSSAKPLVDSGHMLASVDHFVTMKG